MATPIYNVAHAKEKGRQSSWRPLEWQKYYR